jgi:hypothetical protein
MVSNELRHPQSRFPFVSLPVTTWKCLKVILVADLLTLDSIFPSWVPTGYVWEMVKESLSDYVPLIFWDSYYVILELHCRCGIATRRLHVQGNRDKNWR